MKWFCLFFSLYLFTLSCLPCNDGEHAHIGQTTSTTAYFSSSGSFPEHTHCEDSCSPFCGCQCCSVTCTLRLIEAFEVRKPAIVEQKCFFPASAFWLQGVNIAIDHPPQFV